MSLSEREFAQSIRRLWQRLDFLQVGEEFSNPASLIPSDEFLRLSLDDKTTYEELYLCGLAKRDFNLLLSEYSFVQFSRAQGTLRFAFYPNPLLGASTEAISEIAEKKEYVDEGILSLEDYLQEVSELRFPAQKPPIRYEYDPNAYVELRHPCSHLHVGFHGDNRWAVSRILTPEAFGLWISKLYFGSAWRSAGLFKIGEDDLSAEELLSQARQGTRVLPDDHFAETERLSFHLS